MAGTVAATETIHGSVKQVKFAWTSAADGTTSGATTHAFNGEILKLVTVPGSAANQPTDLYDVTVTDRDSVDVLAGGGANRSNASAETVDRASLGAVVESVLTLHVSNAGDSKGGTVILYIR